MRRSRLPVPYSPASANALSSFASAVATQSGRFQKRNHAANFIKARVTKGTKLNADEAAAWDGLHKNFEVARINHEEAYSFDGACTNWAESYFSRLRRA